MQSMTQMDTHSLTFIDCGYRNRVFEVRSSTGVVATLRRVGGIDFRTTVETTDGRWTFARETHTGRTVTIRDMVMNTPIAHYQEGFISNGALSFADGPTFSWERRNILGTAWQWTDRHGAVLMHITSVLAWRSEAAIRIEASARTLPELALLVPLSGYLLGFLYGGGFPLPRWLIPH